MTGFFMFCAVVGGTVLICQFVMTLVGLGGHDLPSGDHGGDWGSAEVGQAGGDLAQDVASPDGHDTGGQHGSTWFFSIVSIRALVAASTFFGLGGLLAESMGGNPFRQLATAGVFGALAMLGVHKVLELFGRLSEDGTVRIQRAIGLEATVYVPIPASRSGVGKVHLNLQHRRVEYAAVTATDTRLATGTRVQVVDVVGADTLEVKPYDEAGSPQTA